MDPRALDDIGRLKRATDSLNKILKDIFALDREREKNLPAITAHLNKLDRTLGELQVALTHSNDLARWGEEYKQDLERTRESAHKQFALDLEAALKPRGMLLSGAYPQLRAGLFTLDIDFQKWQVMLWYGPKQELLGKCSVAVPEVTRLIDQARKQLGCGLPESEFIAKTYEAYGLLGKPSEPVPINQVLDRFRAGILMPEPAGAGLKEKAKPYSRADFSFDLYRLKRSDTLMVRGSRLQLAVAVRAFTRSRKDFLWIPDDESGKGTTYSHMQFKEASA